MSDLVDAAPGQCRLQVDSTIQISLQRFKGAYLPLKISGAWSAKLIPVSGPTLANTGLNAATLYYIYAYDNAGTLALEASATGYATDTDTGVTIKSGDASRSLVGIVYMGAGVPGTFVDSTTSCYLLNYYNRRHKRITNNYTAARATNTTTIIELNTEIRIDAIVWGDESTQLMTAGRASIGSSGGPNLTTLIGEDGVTTILASVTMNTGISGASHNQGLHAVTNPAEGYHFWTVGVACGNTAQSGTWAGSTVNTGAISRMQLSAIVVG